MRKQRQRFSIEELQKLDNKALLIKVREIMPDPMEVALSPEEIQALKVIAETEKISAAYNYKGQEASQWQDRWQSVIDDLAEIEKGRPGAKEYLYY